MSALAHTFESLGLVTVALISVRSVAERMHPPRALFCDFPLGRPLGKPNDAEYQHDVLRRAFALLDAPGPGPVLETHPDTIRLDDAAPLACSLPPRYDPSVPAAVDEARALRAAWGRTFAERNVTSVGRVADADGIPALLDSLARIVGGAQWDQVGLPGDPVSVAHDIRSYYEEASLALVTGSPDPGAAEAWFYDVTEAGKLLLAARRVMREQGAPMPFWMYMARATRA